MNREDSLHDGPAPAGIRVIRADGTVLEAADGSLVERGLAVLLDSPLEANEAVTVRALLPDYMNRVLVPVRLDCRVNHQVALSDGAGSYRVGLSITHLEPTDRHRLLAFVRQASRPRKGLDDGGEDRA